MSDPFGDEETPEIKTVDDCWERVGTLSMETLKYGKVMKEKFPQFADELKAKLAPLKEKQGKDDKLGDHNSIVIGERKYWKSIYGDKLQVNRTMPSKAGAGGYKPSMTTVFVPINVGVFSPDKVTPALLSAAEGTFKKIIYTDRNPSTAQHEFVVETYKVEKTWGSSKEDKKDDEKKPAPAPAPAQDKQVEEDDF
jgi:hypothetical protein